MAFRHVLQNHPILGRLPASGIDLICAHSREASYSRNSVLYQEGDAGIPLSLVIHGIVRLTRQVANGKHATLGLLGPDDVFGPGDQPMIRLKVRDSAIACDAVKVIQLPWPSWETILREHPKVGHVMLEALLASRCETQALLEEMAFLRVEERLAKLLCRISRWGTRRSDGRIGLPRCFTQQKLADAVGAARPIVTRRLSSLVQSGLIKREGRQFVIPDLLALEKRVCRETTPA